MKLGFAIGCRRYRDPRIADLEFSDRDAVRFANILVSACGFARDDVIVLHDGQDEALQPSRENAIRELASTTRALSRPVELVAFFFSGHGFQSAGRDFLVTKSATGDALEHSALDFEIVVELLGRWNARHTVLFLDACRNIAEAGKGESGAFRSIDARTLAPPGVVSVQSCGPDQKSYESEELGSGLFTFALERAFSDDGRCKTVYELDSYLHEKLPLLCRQSGKPTQVPWTRVEPLGAEHVALVSERKYNEWVASTPIGKEFRGPSPADGGHAAEEPVTCAIDFGTTYSVIAMHQANGQVRLVPDAEGHLLVPSVVTFEPDLDYTVGRVAVEREAQHPRLTLRNIKRRLGSNVPFMVEGRSVTAELATSLVIRSLMTNLREFAGVDVREVLASVPAHFRLREQNALIRAFELAGLKVKRLIPEPSVAALLLDDEVRTSGLSNALGGGLVVDLGGGTLDVAVVALGQGIVEVKSVAGDTLGGFDYDEAMRRHLERAVRGALGDHERALSPSDELQLRREAERAKVALSRADRTTVLVRDLETAAGALEDVSVDVSRDDFRSLTANLNDRVKRALLAGLGAEDGPRWRKLWEGYSPRYILLAGQATKIFTVREALDSLDLNAKTIDEHQENAVARGLSRQLGVLAGSRRDLLLLDAIPRTIGVRCAEIAQRDANDSPFRALTSDERNRLTGEDRLSDLLGKEETEIVLGEEETNTKIFDLLKPWTIFPTRQVVRGVTELAETYIVLLEALASTPEEHEVVAEIPIGPCGRRLGIDLHVEVDSTIWLDVRFSSDAADPPQWELARRLQLNNLHRDILWQGEPLEKLATRGVR